MRCKKQVWEIAIICKQIQYKQRLILNRMSAKVGSIKYCSALRYHAQEKWQIKFN